ncbi:L-aspartate oxidase [Candidatus Nitrosymbiomonas proteolyticus]|uniref:L-aspartate oxidase n=1 Tax=Candidatus Nitrosymbiomonas proteolyticus TaxID=2608984 RepID=A0A809SE63_9BACT|nr:L-aspartate oxidase [Candidatus Nitrosymbiomonas proteolyticus]
MVRARVGLRFDYLAIGSGLAGLTFALRAAEQGTVGVVTKSAASEANTSYAQGGIAAAVGEADSWELHEQDTLIAGAGLCDPLAVRFLVQNAPAAIEWLLSLGVPFDRGPGGLDLGLEGGHSQRRIVHSKDRTGWEIERTMIDSIRAHPNITVIENAYATALHAFEGRCVGASVQVEGLGPRVMEARATLLATGGCGVMYLHTTNPRVATADGVGLAHALGAAVENMEFMQFHPTALYHPQLRGFLISEACRGAGGTLRNHLGRRFMYDYDERLELAPRDIVARAIDSEMKKHKTWCVYLDMTHLSSREIRTKFPTIYERLLSIGLEADKDWIPVTPAQHYSCGGVKTDLSGRTSIPGLYAAGEVSCTGVHGANRLASNSLLEALVFGSEAASACTAEPPLPGEVAEFQCPKCIPETEAIVIRRTLQHTMSDFAGVVRTDEGLLRARGQISKLFEEYSAAHEAPHSPYPLETLNLLTAASYVVEGAIRREDNVGLHFNADRAQ